MPSSFNLSDKDSAMPFDPLVADKKEPMNKMACLYFFKNKYFSLL
jgi:hypothetical protein